MGVWSLWCGAFAIFWGKGSSYPHRRIILGMRMVPGDWLRRFIAGCQSRPWLESIWRQCIEKKQLNTPIKLLDTVDHVINEMNFLMKFISLTLPTTHPQSVLKFNTYIDVYFFIACQDRLISLHLITVSLGTWEICFCNESESVATKLNCETRNCPGRVSTS